MPYDLALTPAFSQAGWKVKIFEKERLEPPHVSIVQRTDKWRVNLRTGEYMDDDPDPKEVPEGLRELIQVNWDTLCTEWDRKYPNNKVQDTD